MSAPRDVHGWLSIEAEARAQCSETMQLEEVATLVVGNFVAWTEQRFARTDGFSPVHRIGDVGESGAVTLCGEMVPEACRRVALTPTLARELGRCRFCENRHVDRGQAA